MSVRGRELRGGWFSSAYQFHFALDPFLPYEALRAGPGPYATDVARVRLEGVTTLDIADFDLTPTLYAAPSYWTTAPLPRLPEGLRLWSAHRLSAIQHPSSKGLLLQSRIYECEPPSIIQRNSHWDPRKSWAYFDLSRDPKVPPRAVQWGDLSATMQRLGDLPLGVRDRPSDSYFPSASWSSPYRIGLPVLSTEHGILGRDR